MAGMGLTPAEIAVLQGVTVKTLRKHCRLELREASPKANAAVALALFKQATGTDGEKKNPVAAMFWLKCRAGWNDRPDTLKEGLEGKKAARQEAAHKVARSGRFAPAAPPRLATVNGTPVEKPQPPTEAPK